MVATEAGAIWTTAGGNLATEKTGAVREVTATGLAGGMLAEDCKTGAGVTARTCRTGPGVIAGMCEAEAGLTGHRQGRTETPGQGQGRTGTPEHGRLLTESQGTELYSLLGIASFLSPPASPLSTGDSRLEPE